MLFEDQAWWMVVSVVLLVVLGAAAAARALSARAAVPTVVASAVLIGLLTLFFAAGSSLLGVIPTPSTVGEMIALAEDAGISIYRQSIPAEANASILFVLCAALGVLAVLTDVVAVGFRRPALAAIPALGILSVPVFVGRNLADPLGFVLTAIVYLALLISDAPRASLGPAAAIGSLAIIGSLLVPGTLPGISRPSARTDLPGLSAGINPVLDLGSDLRRAENRTVLTYRTDSSEPHYLRLVTLDAFTGDTWAPTLELPDPDNTLDEFGPAPGLSSDVATEEESTSVSIGSLASPWLPMTYPPTQVSGLSSGWTFDPAGFSVSNPNDTARGLRYTIDSLVVAPTPEQLLAAGAAAPAGFEQYLALPESLPQVIRDTALTVTADAPTNYEKALALQQFFRVGEFVYSEDAPVEGGYDGNGMDVIAEFLEAKSGYCVHFASAMAVMGRSLDIPSRVVVGFLPGNQRTVRGITEFEVGTHDLHAWPELFFEGVGWIPFEPTTGRGTVSGYADVSAAGVPAPAAPASAAPSAAPSTPASERPDLPGDERAAPGAGSSTVPPLVLGTAFTLLALFGLSAIPGAVRQWRRRKLQAALARGDATAAEAWREVLRTADDLRLPFTGTATPRETARELAVGGEAMLRLVHAVEIESYAAMTTGADAGAVATLTAPPVTRLDRDVDGIRGALAGTVGRRRQIAALLYPRSLWRSILRPGGRRSADASVGLR